MFHCVVDKEIELRLVEKQHATLISTRVEENIEHLGHYMQSIGEHYSLADAEMYIALVRSYFAEEKTLPLTIWHKGRFVGMVDAKEINHGDKSAEVGYWIEGASQGKGIVTRALAYLLDYLFGTLELNRVIIRCQVDNIKSRAIPDRLGFHLDGVMREEVCLEGRYADMAVYSKLHSEWQSDKEKTAVKAR